MTTAEVPRTSEYHLIDWGPVVKPVDMIPIVGLFTSFNRTRRLRDLSVRRTLQELSREILRPRQWLLIGTADWPQPSDWKAVLRGSSLAARNSLFAAYHASSPIWGYYLYHRWVAPAVSAAIEQLPKLPTF